MDGEAGIGKQQSDSSPFLLFCAKHCALDSAAEEPQGEQECFKISGVLVLGFHLALGYLGNSSLAEWHFLRGETAVYRCSP